MDYRGMAYFKTLLTALVLGFRLLKYSSGALSCTTNGCRGIC